MATGEPRLDGVMRQIRLLLLALLTALVVLTPRAALAHDELIGTDPEDGASVSAPEELTLTFSGEIAQIGATVVVTGPDGQPVVDGAPEVVGTEVVQPLAAGLGDGDYEVVWRVTSQDGHPISGTFGFVVTGSGEAAGGATEETTEAQTTPADETTEPEQSTSRAAKTSGSTDSTEPTESETGTGADQAQDAATDGGGMPVWTWVAIAAGVALLGYALSVTVRNNRR